MEGQISFDEYSGRLGVFEDWSWLPDALDTLSAFVGKAWDIMAANPLICAYVAAGLLSLGVGFFLYLRRTSRH